MFRNHVNPATFAVLSIAVLLAANPSPAAEPKPVAPDWQLRDINGKQVSLADFKGKLVILDFCQKQTERARVSGRAQLNSCTSSSALAERF